MSEKAMAHYPNLWRRGTRYYLRKRVPSDLIAALGKKTHVVVSLRTGDRRIAERKYGVELGNVERRFERLRAEQQQAQRLQGQLTAGKLHSLAGADLDALVHDWFRETVQPVSLGEPDDWHEHRIEVQVITAELESDDPDQWRDYVEHVADQILLRAGTPPQADHRRIKRRVRTPAIDKACPQYQHLCRLVRRALLVGTRRDLADVTGRPMADDDPLFSLASTKPVARPTCITLDDLIRAFEADPGRAGSSAKVAMEYAMVFRAMREVIGGDKDVNEITRDDFRRLRDLFLALPPNATKRFPQLTLTEAAERAATAKLTPLNPKTVNTHVGKVATLFNWAVREDFVRHNLAKGLQVKNAAEAQRDREPFTTEHLQAIFFAPLYTGCRDDERNYAKPGPNRPRRCRFWAPLLALFLGVRANECCQLRVDDVAEQDGYPVLVIRKSNFTQRLKTRAARRIVPLHPEIVRMGFLGFVARARAAGQERLFPEMKLNSRGLYSDQLIDWFLGFLDHCGVQERSFHCFRHTWADRLRAAGVPEDRRKELGGWANASVGARYGLGSPTSMLAADIASITYPGLDLSHL